mgnify:CR=1 FL=1
MTVYEGAYNAGPFPTTHGPISAHARPGEVWVEDDDTALLEMAPPAARKLAAALVDAADWAEKGAVEAEAPGEA